MSRRTGDTKLSPHGHRKWVIKDQGWIASTDVRYQIIHLWISQRRRHNGHQDIKVFTINRSIWRYRHHFVLFFELRHDLPLVTSANYIRICVKHTNRLTFFLCNRLYRPSQFVLDGNTFSKKRDNHFVITTNDYRTEKYFGLLLPTIHFGHQLHWRNPKVSSLIRRFAKRFHINDSHVKLSTT